MTGEIDIFLPDKLLFLVNEQARYKVVYGGRGGLKSHTIARGLIIKSLMKKELILCTRNYQNSIADSVHKLLKQLIYFFKLDQYFNITTTTITSCTGSEFIFKGLERSISEIKSLEGVTICWVEEATKVSKNSWDILIPTVRKEHSEIWISYNPDEETDYTHKNFVLKPRRNSIITKTYYYEYDCLPKTLVEEAENLKIDDPEAYSHIWLGNCKKRNDAQVFKDKWEEKVFETLDEKDIYGSKIYAGIDWGFSTDPTVLITMFIKQDGRHKDLYIEHEAYGVGIDINDLSKFFKKVPNVRSLELIADNARPETISYLAQPYDERNDEKGFNIIATKKWKGSVEDGISILRSFRKIYIHSRCQNTLIEAQYYSYKTDKISGEIKKEIEDKFNHCWDAIRYGLDRYIRSIIHQEPDYDSDDNDASYDLTW